jgi:aspartyl-tRNA(Asn)/glutamyl-tRNA(Gln) amidotransferase subunit A
MTLPVDLIRAMARHILGRDDIEEAVLAETAKRYGALLTRVRAADEAALQRVAPAFSFNPAAAAFTGAPPREPAPWLGWTEAGGGSGYGGTGTTGVAAPPPVPPPSAGPGPEYLWWSAAQMAAAVRAGEISPVELTRAVLERIEATAPTLNAFVTVMAESALAEARQAEEEAARRRFRGPLHGVPIALKDLIETAGVRTTGGSRVLAENVPAQDATCVTRLRAAGAVIVGKTATHEFAFGPTTDSIYHGPTRNPWNTACVPGGSSGGSGAAVAAGLVPVALGTDTGGSIRMPAAACGIFGIKPTYGRVSKAGVLTLSWSLDHLGPLSRTAEDAALVLSVIAGADPLDPSSLPLPVPHFRAEMEPAGLKGVRLGIPVAWVEQRVDPEVLRSFREAAGTLKELGAELVEVTLPPADVMTFTNRLITFGEVGAYHPPLLERGARAYSPDVRFRVEVGQHLLARDYLTGQRMRGELARQVAAVMERVDAILTPAMPIPAPRIGQSTWEYGEYREAVQESMIRFAAPFAVTGHPAAAVPCGLTSGGLPLSLQVVGRPFAEGLVLRIAAAFEQAAGSIGRPPGF